MAEPVSVDLRSHRQPYKEDQDVLLERDLPTRDPVQLFNVWFQEAKACKGILEPNAVCLSTSTRCAACTALHDLLGSHADSK